MTADNHADDDHAQKLRQLGHDVKSHLAVISMGVEALGMMNLAGDELKEFLSTIEDDGVKPLKATVQELIDIAIKAVEETDSPSAD